jgi:hypothetical protein
MRAPGDIDGSCALSSCQKASATPSGFSTFLFSPLSSPMTDDSEHMTAPPARLMPASRDDLANADEITAEIVAGRLVDHLERAA